MAETSGLLNRRTGYSRTEGSNPSVSASHTNSRYWCGGSCPGPPIGIVAVVVGTKCGAFEGTVAAPKW